MGSSSSMPNSLSFVSGSQALKRAGSLTPIGPRRTCANAIGTNARRHSATAFGTFPRSRCVTRIPGSAPGFAKNTSTKRSTKASVSIGLPNELAFSGGRERERSDRRVRPTATPGWAQHTGTSIAGAGASREGALHLRARRVVRRQGARNPAGHAAVREHRSTQSPSLGRDLMRLVTARVPARENRAHNHRSVTNTPWAASYFQMRWASHLVAAVTPKHCESCYQEAFKGFGAPCLANDTAVQRRVEGGSVATDPPVRLQRRVRRRGVHQSIALKSILSNT